MRSRLFLYFLVALIVGLAAWSFVTPIDMAVRARGIARPSHELVQVVADVSGVITTVALGESLMVRQGDVLLTLDTAGQTVRLHALESQIHFSELRLAELDKRLAALATVNAAAADLDAAEFNDALAAAQKAVSQAHTRMTRTTELYNNDVASRQTLDETRAEAERAEADASRLRASSLELKRAQAETRFQDLAAERTPLLASIASAYKELQELRLEITRLTVTSPVSGRIASAAPLHRGEFITAGSAIATILPDSDALIVESWLPSSDRAFVSPGQAVRLRLETSSGSLDLGFDGVVSSISPDVHIDNSSGLAAYRLMITPQSDVSLELGAAFDVHFITRRERLLFLPFQRIRREFQEAF